MNTLSIIIDLMIRNNCDNKELASALGLNRQLITDWKAGRSRSFMKYLPQIAEYFEVTLDYLIGSDPDPNRPEQDPALSDTKKELLDLIGSVEDDEKIKQILEYVEFVKGRK